MLAPVSVIQWLLSQSTLFARFLSWALWLLAFIHSNPLWALTNHGIMSSGMVATCYETEGTIDAFEIPKIVVLCLHREIHKNTGKSTQTQSIEPKILSIPPYNPFRSIFGHYHKSIVDLCDYWSNSCYWFRVAYVPEDYSPEKGGFLSPEPSHVLASVWAWVEPNQYHLLPKARPKSHSFRNSKHISLHIKTLSGPFYRPIRISFVFGLFNKNAILHRKIPFSGTQIIYNFIYKPHRVWLSQVTSISAPLLCIAPMRYIAIAYRIVLRLLVSAPLYFVDTISRVNLGRWSVHFIDEY